jgi:16S rRNA (uracil1498-N3)-methyltransferase
MSDRFYSAEPITTERVTLDGPEAHHLLHVMRAAVGDHITLFDNSGAEFPAEIEKLHRSNVDLRVVERVETDRELAFPLTIGIALPKGDRQKWLVEKLTELGVTTLVPLETARGVAQPTASALERLERSAIEAAKQCGRNRLMRIAEPQTWSDWLAAPQSEIRNPKSEIPPLRLIAHPGATQLSKLSLAAAQPTAIAIGPEGGLTDEEVAAATAAGWQTVDLGPRILRVETAAIALAAAIALRT